ncbi:MAG: hypothetical protein H7Y30_07820 [Pyrinomonadaceae bacterium]|nr:hypothetical protein [Pyrinomonadaceae bacterium]
MKLNGNVSVKSAASTTGLSVWRSLPLCLLLLFVAAGSIKALDPNKLITQYGHTAWRVQEGYFTSPTAITQTADGYIWLGTVNGLVRFDGVKFTPWTPPEGQALPSSRISALLSASDGSLWIGTTFGISQLKDGRIINYLPPPGTSGIYAIIEDETEAIWFTRYRITDGKGPLCRVKDKELRCYGKEDGVPVSYGLGLVKDVTGNIWFGSSALCRWTPESSEVFFEEDLKHNGGDGAIAIATDPSGTIWAALDGVGPKLGVRYYSGERWFGYVVPGFNGPAVQADTLYKDRHGSLWVGSTTEGLYRIHNGIAHRYGMKDGLSGNYGEDIFEDREGNLWVLTENGVDMFRDTPVVNFSSSEGLSSAEIAAVLALRDGSVWIANVGAVDVIPPGGRSPITTLKGLPGQRVKAIVEDHAGRIWLGVDDRLMTYENKQFSEVRKPDGSPLNHAGMLWAITADGDGNIWVGIFKDDKRRLLRIKGQTVEEDIPLYDRIRRAETLAADRQGGVWIGSSVDSKLTHYRNGQMESFSLGDEGIVPIYSIFVDSDDALWAATEKGLYRWKDGVLSLLNSRNNLPCSPVYSAINDDFGNFWLYAQCGLLKIPASDMATWLKSPESKVSVKTFDALDGALPAPGGVNQRRASKSPDGRLWFTNGTAAQMIDPLRNYDNTIPPPVYIEGLVADRKSYQTQGQLNLPPLRSELEINYTALSYTVPRKVKFRYKLEGHDADWHDAGTRRQAFYNNLGPGQYRFRVVASNNDGVWNETEATFSFDIAPTFYQTYWFLLLCIGATGCLVWMGYRWRLRQMRSRLALQFEERLQERTRIARELHDTLLQGYLSAAMQLHVAANYLSPDSPAKPLVSRVLEIMGQVNREGRATLKNLRSANSESLDLAQSFSELLQEMAISERIDYRVVVEGRTQPLNLLIGNEVYRIGREAVTNAVRHSGAQHIAVELKYVDNCLSLLVRDDGCGIDPVVLREGRDGHWGLSGMRERAKKIGGQFDVRGHGESGTEVTLSVPGHIAFQSEASGRSAGKFVRFFRP